MRVLAIESSCDETALAVVFQTPDGRFLVEQNVIASQAQTHAKFGGVVPEVAAREHAALALPLLHQLGVAHDGQGIDALAVTAGPGLVPALRVGVELGKTLAWAWKKPLVAVNHLEGHIYSVWLSTFQAPSGALDRTEERLDPTFPALCLLVSGGHTELILMKDHGRYELLGMTRDDAAGEAFDKVAKLLGLSYPGGPEIAKAAEQGNRAAIAFPRPMLDSGDLDFSFAGLKTAVRVYLEGAKGRKRDKRTEDIAASFQQAVVDTLVGKTLRAVDRTHPHSVMLVGGVSANRLLRETLKEALATSVPEVMLHVPDLALTGDNAAMIALTGLYKAKRGEFCDPLTLQADPHLRLA
ncbi:tRNA (adenosine(37)-N6)-threonylcarbamoyltransferase complex transferase subunit TsaD [Candidatus Uhrbacteria bacterium]|nr:tRNA (adenosine(37)-N6)-threonylcarbamoyltransferase complex transferase subunit TsaD [Candidatus Uhrbacteria bacterium]